MSAQEREALVELLTEVADDQFAGRLRGGYIPETADRLLAAGWTRSVSDADAIERAAREVAKMSAFGFEQARELITALLASPVREPGRSEAEIKAEALREHREGWADWIGRQGAYVGTTELTQAEIVDLLRSGVVPFGTAAGTTDTEGTDHE